MAKAVVAKVGQTLAEINEIPELDEGAVPDKKVADAVTQVKENVKTTSRVASYLQYSISESETY